MKKTLNFTFSLLLFVSGALSAQNVNIPDSNFKTALLANTAINTNADNEIQISEAQSFTGTMNVNFLNIADLTGIEAFTNLTRLICNENLLTTLNLSANTALTHLYCDVNSISSLDLSSNSALIVLYCHTNPLTNLNFGNNTALTYLDCHDNLLTALDLSGNTAFTGLSCSGNQLTTLNVKNGNNTAMTSFFATNNPNLLCIEVDDATYSTTNWTQIDAASSFSTNCFSSINNISTELISLTASPNPTTGKLFLNFDKSYNNLTIEVQNIMGQVISSKNYSATQQIELEINGTNGIYFVKTKTEKGEAVVKVVKS